MNAFHEHHKNSIGLQYRCFDRLLLNGLIQPFQQPERVIGFFNTYRDGKRVTRNELGEIADQYKNWVTNRSGKWSTPVMEAPDGRRDDLVDPYFKNAKPDQVVAILRAREPGRILVANGSKKDDKWHLQMAQRWIIQYNFCVNDAQWGRMFVRLCPYFPFTARVCLNQHHWLANRMREEKIDFKQSSNAFLKCAAIRSGSRNWPTRSPLRMSWRVVRNGLPRLRRSSLRASGKNTVVNIGSSLPKWSTATTSSSSGARLWMPSVSDYWMPTGRSRNRIRSRPSSAAK